jgi:hypothetical protein
MKVFKEIIAYFSHMNNKRRTLVWYIISLSIVLIEYLINSRLDKLVYFHPFISIVINIVLLIDLFFIPITFIAIDILKAQKNSIIKFFQIILSGIGIGLLSFTVIFVYSFFNKSSFNIDSVSIDFRSDKIYVENVVWLEDSHHVDVYQIENAFFVRRIDSYKL